MLSKTQIYLDHFARFKRKENVEAVERLLSAHKELAKFERAQLGTSQASILRTPRHSIQHLTYKKLTSNRLPVLR
jgi:DNA-directed RNA polymerase II subunit RPB4